MKNEISNLDLFISSLTIEQYFNYTQLLGDGVLKEINDDKKEELSFDDLFTFNED